MPMSGSPQIGEWLDSSSIFWDSQGWLGSNRSAMTQKMVLHPDGVILYAPGADHWCWMKANGDTTWTKASTPFYTGISVHAIIAWDPDAEILWWVGSWSSSFLIRAFTVDFSTPNITIVDTHSISQFDGTVWAELAWTWGWTGDSNPWLTIGGDMGTTDGMWFRSVYLSGTTITDGGADTSVVGLNLNGQNIMYQFLNQATYGDGRQQSYHLGSQVNNEASDAFHLRQVDAANFSSSLINGIFLVHDGSNSIDESNTMAGALENYRTSTAHDVYSQPAYWKTAGGAGRVLWYCSSENQFILSTRTDLVNDTDSWTETSQGNPTGFSPGSVADVSAVHCVYSPVDDKVYISIVEHNVTTYDLHFCEWSESGGFANLNIYAVTGNAARVSPGITDNAMTLRDYGAGALVGVFDETTGRGYASYFYYEGDGTYYSPVEYNLVDSLVVGGAPSAWGVWGT